MTMHWRNGKAEALIRALNGVYVARGLNDEVHVLLRAERLISLRTYLSFPGTQVGGAWRNLSALIPLFVVVVLALLTTTNVRNLERSWFEWRLSKTNVTASDLARTQEALIQRIASTPQPEPELQSLGGVIRETVMTPGRVDVAIGIMTDAARQSAKPATVQKIVVDILIESLRTPNVDSRTRVQSGLLYLADLKSAGNPKNEVLEKLREWKPSQVDSVTVLAARIDAWRSVFTSQP